MLRIPANYVHTRATPFWNQETAPKALFTHHNTKAGVYGRLSVMQGAVRYFGFADANATEPDLELVKGSAVAGDGNVALAAGNDVDIVAASNSRTSFSRRTNLAECDTKINASLITTPSCPSC
jgi:tellurite resistance-related uncharacterized protein